MDEPNVYSGILQSIADKPMLSADLSVIEVGKIWDYLIWSLIFDEFRDNDPAIKAASILVRKGNASHFIHDLLRGLLNKYVDDSGKVADDVSATTTSPIFTAAQAKVLEHTRKEPIIVAIDTFERYDRENVAMMVVTAALIQRANEFNISYASKGIHVKAFVSAEIFPHIKESIITNTTKFIRNPIYLRWKPRDLIRLIMWRFYRYMQEKGHQLPAMEPDCPRVADIITALTNAPVVFRGNYLDQVAKRTSSAWPHGTYSTAAFRRVVAELGIVGKVRAMNESSSIIAADFEYAMQDRLTLTSDDDCVIHPMFYSKLQVKRNGWIVYPFPDHEDYQPLLDKK